MVASTTSCGTERDSVELEKGPRLPALCKLPAAPGLCLAYFPRWFFNSKTGKCEKFIYGGCGGNKNNFLTKEECDKTCWCPPPCRCYCEFGFQTDEYGCKICKCVDPCKGVFCPTGQICEAKKVWCKKAPCPPVTQCVVPDPNCCDGRPYDHVKQICCQRRLYDRQNDVDCCAVDSIYSVNKPYNVIKEICCQGVVQERPMNAECCGKKAFDVKRQFCCQGKLYNRHPDVICPDCCGAKPYSTMDELCCSGVVSWKPRNGKCCGKKAYNALEETCCDGVVQKRPTNAACCGRVAYDSLLFVCCGGKVQERPVNAFG
ncbi:hypothetical protein NP493_1203g00012 [Ridgeia piscesae]|uniref:Uncharacterized protein n=1 Tax=Ridgeia piscesae TaxID=27915 RepID=A0AAD9NJ34_RIDPI|nr:hypothetical protein NP493_1203g00012 [Ridgeia piscesae]